MFITTCNIFLFVATPLSTATYLRFSNLPIEDIQRRLYLQSEGFVFAMFETMVDYNIVCVRVNYVCDECVQRGHREGKRGAIWVASLSL